MALPTPTFSFTIPSIYDGNHLACRLYTPTKLLAQSASSWSKRAAIVAHPYAPLGGCSDDPIVHSIGRELLRAGYVVGTFNFRGAGDSSGRTSWSAKPELNDYISFCGFMIHYLHGINSSLCQESAAGLGESSDLSSTASPPRGSTSDRVVPTTSSAGALADAKDVLILGGYSYGSMITIHLPPIELILDIFASAATGSAEAEILSQALNLSSLSNRDLEARNLRRGRSLEVSDALRSPSHCVKVGGQSPEQASRRSSHDSRRSMENFSRSLSMRKAPSRNDQSTETLEATRIVTGEVPAPDVRFLLVSPLLPPVSSFTSMFTKLSFTPREGSSLSERQIPVQDVAETLTSHRTLAIYGDQDFFTSARKLKKWSESLASRPRSSFHYEEIVGAGHFWHEDGVESKLRDTIRRWV